MEELGSSSNPSSFDASAHPSSSLDASAHPSSSLDASAHHSSSLDASAHPSSSDASSTRTQEDMKYSCALKATVSNFVSVKLSGDENYHLWQEQMGCLLESYGVVDKITTNNYTDDVKNRFNILVKGWIFGSISEELLVTVVHLKSAKEVWDKLKSFYQNSTEPSPQQKKETATAKDVPIAETERNVSDKIKRRRLQEIKEEITKMIGDIGELFTSEKEIPDHEDLNTRNEMLRNAIVEGSWDVVESMIKKDEKIITEPINSDGSMMLHIAVGVKQNSIVKCILSYIDGQKLSEMKNDDGSTPLHIAAIVGNARAAELLVKKYAKLLESQDFLQKKPLEKAYESMHLDTIEYLLKAVSGDGQKKKRDSDADDDPLYEKIGVNLLVNAVSGKEYDLATYLIDKYPTLAANNDKVLMAIAETFPSGLEYWETLVYPSMDHNYEKLVKRAREWFSMLLDFYNKSKNIIKQVTPGKMIRCILLKVALFIIIVPLGLLYWILRLIPLLIISMVYFPLSMSYYFLWKISSRLIAPIEHIEIKKKEWEGAKKVLNLVCKQIDESTSSRDNDTSHTSLYAGPVLEAARQDAYDVVDEILTRSPGAIRYKDKSSGYGIIQLAVLHRSEKVYSLIYTTGSVYRMTEDSSNSNLLHLAGRLPPSHKLDLRTGAALQLQRELQWREEVKKHVSPAYVTKKNIFMKTPAMVFTKEHSNLVKEGEQWMKTVAESCSITAALITTIVFAAAFTVPGGNDEKYGIPLFRNEIAFTIFAISDAISLFASSTALLMFQSILTGRFSEEDFLFSLPKRLIIGLCTLIISTASMMTAFSATLFLVFFHGKPWMLTPICLLALVPVASFSALQIKLIVDLIRSTYCSTFPNQSNEISHRFNRADISLYFGK